MHLARSTQKVHNLQVHGRVKPKQHKGLLVRSGVLQSLCHWVACIVIKCGKRNYKASPIEVYDICPYCEMVISHTYIIIICHTYRYDLWPAYISNAIYPRVSTVCELESHRLNRSSSNRPGERKAHGNRRQSVCWGPWRSGATEKVPSGHRKNDGKNTMFS